MAKEKFIQIRCTEELWQVVREAACKERLYCADLVENIIREWIADREERLKRCNMRANGSDTISATPLPTAPIEKKPVPWTDYLRRGE